MKLQTLLLIVLVFMCSCKEKTAEINDTSKNDSVIAETIYPENLSKVFDAHGGLDLWKQMQTLQFTIPEDNGNEVNKVALKSRKTLIEMPNHTIGFNGKDVWLLNIDTTVYKGNPKFYYNLMYYFYTMPFVLADDGIQYKAADTLIFEDKSYPGIKISYEKCVGESPDDEYILYYDKDTHKMACLSYTVTFFSKEKSKKFNFIKYSGWQTINGLLLPEILEWYTTENNTPITKRNEVKFIDVAITKQQMLSEDFEKPEGAKIVE
jgi:hypothetical protein